MLLSQIRLCPSLEDKLHDLHEEYRFCPGRKFAADFAFPGYQVLIEVEGLVYGHGESRHTSLSGYTKDCEKYNLAAILGYRIIRVTQEHIQNGKAIEWIVEILS